MKNFDWDFYSTWNTLDKLNEAAELQMTFDEVENVLSKDKDAGSTWGKQNKLRDIMLDMCKTKSGTWKTSPATWPYQLQLMYNAYKLECKAIEILDTKIKDCNEALLDIQGAKETKEGIIQLMPGIWKPQDDRHNTLELKNVHRGTEAIDLCVAKCDEAKMDKTKNYKYVDLVEVKGTVGKASGARSFHNAQVAIIFVFDKGTKEKATPYIALIKKNEFFKAKAICDSINVDCIEIKVHNPKYPTVNNLDIKGLKSGEISGDEVDGEIVKNPIEDEQIG